MDGRVVAGRYIPEQAYAFFLAGALAEEGPDLRAAVRDYEGAARVDPHAPEVWTRAARVRCRIDPADPVAASELTRALSLDPAYEPALDAKAFCEAARTSGPTSPAALAAVDEPSVALAMTEPPAAASPDDERRRLEALTLLHGHRVAAWEALAAWGHAHDDAVLEARGLVGVAARAPSKRLAVAGWAVALAGGGHLIEAREVAAALLDAPGDRSSGGEGRAPASLPLVARLALDDALLARDAAKVYARSAMAHLGLEVAAGRAWALGDLAEARGLVALTAKADPSNLEARLVHEGAAGRAEARLLPSSPPDPSGAAFTGDVVLPFARQVLLTEGLPAARRVLAATGVRLAAGDALLAPLAVDLAIAGALGDEALPADARIELAARRGAPPAEADVADPSVDARHRLLGLALLRPTDPATDALAARLAGAASEDALVAVALARIHLARSQPLPPLPAEARARLDATAAADPLVAAALVDLAIHDGPAAALPTARHRLAALAKTPAERARAAE